MIFSNRYDSLFEHYSTSRLPWKLLKAQAAIESSLDPDAVNEGSQCRGLVQFADATFREVVAGLNLKNPYVFNPEHAIRAQVFYMTRLIAIFPSVDQALAAYNWGMGNMLKIYLKPNWMELLPKETHDYVNSIKALVVKL